MADVAWTQINDNRSSTLTYQAIIDDTDTATEPLKLDPARDVTFAIQGTVDAYTVNVLVWTMDDISSPNTFSYNFAQGVGTVSGVDYIKSSIGPITGIKISAASSQAGETVTTQVMQTKARSI